MVTAAAPPQPDKSLVDRFLGLFASVRAGEGGQALLLCLNLFLLFTGYYLMKTVRESLVLTEGGATVKAYASAGQAALLLLIIPAYSVVASKLNRFRLVAGVTAFFGLHLAIFAWLGAAGVHIGVAFYIWLGIFNTLVIAQFWAFANDLYRAEAGERLFGVIAIGASLGSLAGARFAKEAFAATGPYQLLGMALVLLAICLGLTWVIDSRRRMQGGAVAQAEAQETLGHGQAFALVARNPYLRWVALLTVLLNTVNTSGEFLVGRFVEEQASAMFADDAARKTFIGQFYGDFFSWVNLLGLVLQLFVTSRLLQLVGSRGALFVLPSIAFGGYAGLLATGSLPFMRVAKITENAVDYSIQSTARHALYLYVGREEKYKAKAAIDTIFMRLGDLVLAVIVWAGTALQFATANFAMLNLVLSGLWLATVGKVFHEQGKLKAEK